MKLIKYIRVEGKHDESHFIDSEEMISEDIDLLKSKASELCRLMGVSPSVWVSRYPIMGDKKVSSNAEFIMDLGEGTFFSIER